MGIPTPNFGLIEQSQPNVLRDYAEMTAIKGAQQQQQLRQQQMQGVQQENQMRQLQLDDQQRLRQASQGIDWSSPNAYDSYFESAVKSGVSPMTLGPLRQQLMQQQELEQRMTKEQIANQQEQNAAIRSQLDSYKSEITAPGVTPDQYQAIYNKHLAALSQVPGIDLSRVSKQALLPNQIADVESGLAISGTRLNALARMRQAEKESAPNEYTTALRAVGWDGNPETLTSDLAQQAMAKIAAQKTQAKPNQTDEYVQDYLGAHNLEDTAENRLKARNAYRLLGPQFTFQSQTGDPGQIEQMARGMVEGRVRIPDTSYAARVPMLAQAMKRAFELDPTLNDQRYQLRTAYTTGKQASEINSINTALGHVGVLSGAVAALQNNNVIQLNRIANFLGIQVGQSPVSTFKTIVNRVGPELVKAYAGTAGGEAEREKIEQDFSPNYSPQQLMSNAKETAKLLRSKISSLENQWDVNKGPGMPTFDQQFIMPAARDALQRLDPQGGMVAQPGQQQPQAGGSNFFTRFGGVKH